MKCILAACWLLLVLSSAACGQSPRHHTLTIGDTIPAFRLPDQDGKIFNSADDLGKSDLVIFFYPKDESMVCTREACRFRDRYADLQKVGAIGIPRQFFMTGRKTFVADKTGKIVFTYTSALNGTRHAEEALAYLQNHPNH
jgi:peroxiredoxin Q/BCP